MERRNSSTSHGIVLFTMNDKKEVTFLVAKRRYTYSYIEFLFRKHHREKQNLICDMTRREIAQLLTYKFEKLWEDYHLESYFDSYSSDLSFRDYAHDLFVENIKKCRSKMLKAIEVPRGNEDKKLIWEFPKGKRNNGEMGLQCALREFKEETGIDTKEFVSIHDSYVENYIGDDDRSYSTILYPMYVKDYKKLRAHRKISIYAISDDYISSEIRCVRWMSENECKKVLPESKMKFIEYILDVMMDLIKNI
jgi:8-oxo-dGTP pyrophosphatase MutT (NUDIX family)